MLFFIIFFFYFTLSQYSGVDKNDKSKIVVIYERKYNI